MSALPLIRIIVATHKQFWMPKDVMYLPLQVGHAFKPDLGYTGDDTGENISSRNATLCELTGLYWAWKNLNADYVGLVHYRRHFTAKSLFRRIGKSKFNCILTSEELREILAKYDLVLPRQRRYFIENLYAQYAHSACGHERDMRLLREVVAERQPDYIQAFDAVLSRTHAHMFNMFIMRWDYFDQYCEWLFSILLEFDKRVDITNYSPMEKRAAAYLGERLLDVWIEKQKLSYCELPVMFMERQNWLGKGASFLMRKIFADKEKKC